MTVTYVKKHQIFGIRWLKKKFQGKLKHISTLINNKNTVYQKLKDAAKVVINETC